MTSADGTGVALLSARGGCDVIGPVSVDGDAALLGSNHTGGPLTATGTITANGCQVGALTSSGANIALVGCTVDGDLSAAADLLVMGSATIGARAYVATTIEIDTGSHAMVLANGGSFTGAGTIYG
jgi:hypothetical protein